MLRAFYPLSWDQHPKYLWGLGPGYRDMGSWAGPRHRGLLPKLGGYDVPLVSDPQRGSRQGKGPRPFLQPANPGYHEGDGLWAHPQQSMCSGAGMEPISINVAASLVAQW